MSKLKSLNTVFTVAKQKEQEIADQLKMAEGELAKHRKYLEDLHQYRNSYSEVSTEKALNGVSAALFRHYQGFLNSIDHGIKHQSGQVDQMNSAMQTQRESWQQAHQYSNAIEGMIEKQHQIAEKIEQKREQKLFDEINLRNFLLNKNIKETNKE